jgi:protein involved in polysaccharide export with SLBB domain
MGVMTKISRLYRAGLFPLLTLAFSLVHAEYGFAADYKLGAQDKLRIKVYEWPALSDEVTVGNDGIIALPLIGSLNAAGATPSELARRIAERLQATEKLTGMPYASVEVIQYRPFYILGDVQKPGEYAYRPGMTVLMALSISGGVYRAADNLRLERDVISSEGALATLRAKRRELSIRLARLETELGGKAKIELGAHKSGSTDAAASSDSDQAPGVVLEQEDAIMQRRKRGFENQIATFRLQIEGYNEEIKLLARRMDSLTRQQKSVEREAQVFKTLGDKGLGLLPRETALERLAAQIEGDQREIDTLSAKARQNITQTEAAMTKLADDRDRDLAIEIRQSTAEFEQVEKDIATQRNLIYEAEALSGADQRALSDRTELDLRIRISRRDPSDHQGQITEFIAQRGDNVEPGDVISVSRILARSESGVRSDGRAPALGAAAEAEIELRSSR